MIEGWIGVGELSVVGGEATGEPGNAADVGGAADAGPLGEVEASCVAPTWFACLRAKGCARSWAPDSPSICDSDCFPIQGERAGVLVPLSPSVSPCDVTEGRLLSAVKGSIGGASW